jgi:hypothetical protein
VAVVQRLRAVATACRSRSRRRWLAEALVERSDVAAVEALADFVQAHNAYLERIDWTPG